MDRKKETWKTDHKMVRWRQKNCGKNWISEADTEEWKKVEDVKCWIERKNSYLGNRWTRIPGSSIENSAEAIWNWIFEERPYKLKWYCSHYLSVPDCDIYEPSKMLLSQLGLRIYMMLLLKTPKLIHNNCMQVYNWKVELVKVNFTNSKKFPAIKLLGTTSETFVNETHWESLLHCWCFN